MHPPVDRKEKSAAVGMSCRKDSVKATLIKDQNTDTSIRVDRCEGSPDILKSDERVPDIKQVAVYPGGQTIANK